MDNTSAAAGFDWRIETPLTAILQEIARHAAANPDGIEVSRA